MLLILGCYSFFQEYLFLSPGKDQGNLRHWFYHTCSVNWCGYSSPHFHIPHLFHKWGIHAPSHSGSQESSPKNLNWRCVSWENKPRNGSTAPRSFSAYSILGCVWLRFPLYCVKVVIKKDGLCGSKVFQGPQSMLNILCPVTRKKQSKISAWQAQTWISLFLMQVSVRINIRIAPLGGKKGFLWMHMSTYSILRQRKERENWHPGVINAYGSHWIDCTQCYRNYM